MLLFNLEYKNKEYYIHFSHFATSRTEEEFDNEKLSEILKTTKGQESLIYHALVAGCHHMNLKAPRREDVPFILDACKPDIDAMFAKSVQQIEIEKKNLEKSMKMRKV